MKVGTNGAALRRKLRASTSVCALCLGTSLLFTGSALADCDNNTPADEDIVICSAPVDTTGISGGADTVTVTVLTGAVIDVNGPDAINLGTDAVIVTQAGSLISAQGANDSAIFVGDRGNVTIGGTVQADHDVVTVGNDSTVTLQSGGLIAGMDDRGRGIVAGNNVTIITEAGSTITTFGPLPTANPPGDAIVVGSDAMLELGGDIFVSHKAQAVVGGENLTLLMHEGATIVATDYRSNPADPGAVVEAQGAGADITINGSITASGANGAIGADGIRIGQVAGTMPATNFVTIGATGSVVVDGATSQAIFIERPTIGGMPISTHEIFVADGGLLRSEQSQAITEDTGVGIGQAWTSVTVAGTVETGAMGGQAIQLFTGEDRLELHSTFSITGDVLGGADTDTFVLGGDLDGTFDASLLDGDGVDEGEQYLEFEVFVKEDLSTWTLTGTNDETFAWDVQNGGILVTGMLTGSSFDLSTGADPVTFGGNGTVSSFNAQDGATVAPGTLLGEIATLTVTNGLSFQAGSVFLVDLDGTPVNDAVVGTGVATINGGEISVVVQPGGYENGEIFTIIDVDTLAGGPFDTVVDNAFLIDFTALYDDAAGLVQLRADLTIETIAETPNEMGAAMGIATADLGDPALADLQALLPLIDNVADTKLLLNGLSGEIYATNLLFSAHTAELFTQSIRHRARVQGGSSGGSMQSAQGDLQLASAALEADDSSFTQVAASGGMEEGGGVSVWGGFIGQVSGFDEDGNATDADHWVAGAAVGVETGWHGDGMSGSVGLGLGYTHGSGEISDGRESDVESDGFHVGVYGALSSGPFALSAAASYSWINSDVSRTLPFGLGETDGDVDSGVVSTSLEASYGIAATESLTISPLAGFDATWVSQDGFDESGAGPALSGDDANFSSYSTALGARLSGMLPMQGDDVAVWEVDAKWRHRFGDDTPSIDLAFLAGAGSAPFEIYGPELGSDWAEVGAGLQYRSGVVSVGVRYDGDFGGSFSNHALSLTVGASF